MGPIAITMSIKKSALFASAWQRPLVCRQLSVVKPQGIERHALRLALPVPRLRALANAVLPCLLGRRAGLRLVASCSRGRAALLRAHFGLSPRFGYPRSGLRLHFNHPSANKAVHPTAIPQLRCVLSASDLGLQGLPHLCK